MAKLRLPSQRRSNRTYNIINHNQIRFLCYT